MNLLTTSGQEIFFSQRQAPCFLETQSLLGVPAPGVSKYQVMSSKIFVSNLNGFLLITWSASFTFLAMGRLWPWDNSCTGRMDEHRKNTG